MGEAVSMHHTHTDLQYSTTEKGCSSKKFKDEDGIAIDCEWFKETLAMERYIWTGPLNFWEDHDSPNLLSTNVAISVLVPA